jgi:hypothetical protein
MSGWHPYENWSTPQDSASHEYIVDPHPKVTFLKQSSPDPVQDIHAINKVRELLKASDSTIRLIGMSGVGKTRFAQALFDSQVGESCLNSGNVVYGDLGESPETTASAIASQLVLSQQETVLVVDNCPAKTHSALTKIILRPGSQVSLLTIDFDVGPDQPENTKVVQLHQNDDSLIDALLVERYSSLSVLDRRRVVEFSDGNARVALTIANNVDESDSLADLSNRELIDRLFLDGRHSPDNDLKRSAEIASLVYAFHIEAESDQKSEVPVLAELAGISETQFFGAISKLVEFGVAQMRGTQRAVLPQALAIKLAVQSLDQIPIDNVLNHFNQPGRERLFKSFTRRLGFLHQSEPACAIAQKLLGNNGPLSDPTGFDDENYLLFQYLAPASPEEALSAIEGAIKGAHGQEIISCEYPNRNILINLARNLAYEKDFFKRAAQVLLAFAKVEKENRLDDSGRSHFLEIFWLGLSHTQAPPEFRFEFLKSLLEHGDQIEKQLAVDALEYSLEAEMHSSSHLSDFGSRSRGQEWRPENDDELADWFKSALRLLIPIACNNDNLARNARIHLSNQIRGLIRIGIVGPLIEAISTITQEGLYSPEIWKKLCMAMYFDSQYWPPDIQGKVKKLEQQLKPVSLEDRFLTYVTADPWNFYPADPENKEGPEKGTFSAAEEVGKDVANLLDTWPSLANQAIAYNDQGACRSFGFGLAKGSTDISEMWRKLTTMFCGSEIGVNKTNTLVRYIQKMLCKLTTIFCASEIKTRNVSMLIGFVKGANEREPDKVQGWLDEAAENEVLSPYIVDLSVAIPINDRSIKRLTKSIQTGNVPLNKYSVLGLGGITHPIPPGDLIVFFKELLVAGDTGHIEVVDILHMYLFGHKDDSDVSPEIFAFGSELLRSSQIYLKKPPKDNSLDRIAKRCLAGQDKEQEARQVFEQILLAPRLHIDNLDGLIRTLGNLHPKAILEMALENDIKARLIGNELFGNTNDLPRNNSHSALNDNVALLFDWVMEEPSSRAIRLAGYVSYFCKSDDGSLIWSPIAEELIRIPGEAKGVLNVIYGRFFSGSSTGPFSNKFVERKPLIEVLKHHTDHSVRLWADDALLRLDKYIAELIEQERSRDERFE